MSPHKDPARKRRIRSKVARLRRRAVPRAPADDRPVPPAEHDAPAAERPSRAGPGEVAAKPPPLPVRGAPRPPADAGDDTSDNPAVPSPFPPMSLLSAEELLADQPSVDMLRRVRRGLRALPESDPHLPE